jgi:hypothetical protein
LANSNDVSPNVFLSVRDVHTIVRELESYEKRIAKLPAHPFASDRRRVRALLEKLYAVKWT